MLYATYSEGFRRGGANALPLCPSNFCEIANDDRQQYAPDTVTNYEIGVKGRIGGGPRYDASVFYVDWQDAQLNTATPIWGFFFVANAGAAHAAGIELSLDGQLNDEWGYSLGLHLSRRCARQQFLRSEPDASLPRHRPVGSSTESAYRERQSTC